MSKYDAIADKLGNEILEKSQKIIGITGTSCIGKSTLTGILREKIEEKFSVTVIDVDSYLKEEIRGGKNFWNRCSEYLKPEYFDWEALAQDIYQLKNGNSVEKLAYQRGKGWSGKVVYQPADYYIVEGLFLDSVESEECMKYDKMVALTASDDYIYDLRVKRDEYYRQNFKDFTRTREETIKEIECTLKAAKEYKVSKKSSMRTEIFVQEDSCTELLGE